MNFKVFFFSSNILYLSAVIKNSTVVDTLMFISNWHIQAFEIIPFTEVQDIVYYLFGNDDRSCVNKSQKFTHRLMVDVLYVYDFQNCLFHIVLKHGFKD